MESVLSEVKRRLNLESYESMMTIAHSLGLSRATLTRIRGGGTRNPGFLTIAALARHYGIKASDFDNGNSAANDKESKDA